MYIGRGSTTRTSSLYLSSIVTEIQERAILSMFLGLWVGLTIHVGSFTVRIENSGHGFTLSRIQTNMYGVSNESGRGILR